MAYNFDRSFVVSDDGVAIESGVHFQSGSGVPVHTVTNASIYFRTNGEIYTNDISGWVLFAGSASSPENFSYHKIVENKTVRIESDQHMITTSVEIDGFLDVEGGIVFL
jgi:hypothetical protein